MATKAGGKPAFRLMQQKLESLGYEFARINAKGWHIYERRGFPDATVNLGISESDARFLARKLDRLHGVNQDTNKRNAQAIKDRRASERARIQAEMDRLDAERARLIRAKELLPTADLDQLSRNERFAIEREIQRIEKERRDWLKMMTQFECVS